MSERKCISKHEQIIEQYQKISNSNNKSKKKIRFMIPIDIKCLKCFIKFKRGKKVNAIKEKILNKSYFGINYIRFYFQCFQCLSGSSITTDLYELKYKPEINCMSI